MIEFPVQFSLDINGILEVKATDRVSGRQVGITVATNHQQLTQAEIGEAITRISTLPTAEPADDDEIAAEGQGELHAEAESLLARANDLLESTNDSGLQELVKSVTEALDNGDDDELRQYLDVLLEFLYENTN